jgi:hypothetical protein
VSDILHLSEASAGRVATFIATRSDIGGDVSESSGAVTVALRAGWQVRPCDVPEGSLGDALRPSAYERKVSG